MTAVFATVLVVLVLLAIRDDIFNGSVFDCAGVDRESGEVVEFPVPDGWSEEDVLTTYAEIQAL